MCLDPGNLGFMPTASTTKRLAQLVSTGATEVGGRSLHLLETQFFLIYKIRILICPMYLERLLTYNNLTVDKY